jgi:pantoate--beta-alanine ligase
MKVIETVAQWQSIRTIIADSVSIGLVATMGCLHKGHEALIEQARQENSITVLSIFVNPAQFNDPKDFKNYPETKADDLALAQRLGVDYVFMPAVSEIYPQGECLLIEVDHPLATIFEGELRPGHYAGVLTVVMKLFQIIRPTHAYFGEKDYQQCRLIQTMVKGFFLSIEIAMCPTIREISGLPFSSRNSRLTLDQKILAEAASQMIRSVNQANCEEVKYQLVQQGIQVDYLQLFEGRIFSAIKIGSIRLIDNFVDTEQCVYS